MPANPVKPRRRATDPATGPATEPATTGDLLVKAAMQEFRSHGYGGTDTNKIARRAGFAPQTFYRWFTDKTLIFLAAYRLWQDEEQRALDALIAGRAQSSRLVDAVIAHHRDYRLFRRSLRQLAVENASVRDARAQSRKAQIDRIRQRSQLPEAQSGAIAATLLQIERLADAFAEGEFDDLGIGASEARRAMAGLIASLSRTP
ncbi:MAG: helix-turn-helix domain-containing protein [Sinimarinibacterium sp.]